MNNTQTTIIYTIIYICLLFVAVIAYAYTFFSIQSIPVKFDQNNSTQVYAKPCMGGTTSVILYCLNQHIAKLEHDK